MIGPAPERPFCVALLGAESTGKSSLSVALSAAATQRGVSASVVPEVLREWCAQRGRVPLPHEQIEIATAQALAMERAARDGTHWVISDTTPLMTAVYSDLLFGDRSLYPTALAAQSGFHLTLLMGLDLPWVADGIQRDGPHVRGPVDHAIRTALAGAQIPFEVVTGVGPERVACALGRIDAALAQRRGSY